MKNSSRVKLLLLGLGVVALSLRLCAQVPATNDLWDVKLGNVVTAHSPLSKAGGSSEAYDPSNIFGASLGTYHEALQGRVIFDDLQPDGFAHFIEWTTAAPVTLRSFRLFATGDATGPANARTFRTFRLIAKDASGGARTLYELSPSRPFKFVDPKSYLLIESSVSSVTAQSFRAEWVVDGLIADLFSGPRILELDGFGEIIHDTGISIRVSEVEICWNTLPGVYYQLEFKPAVLGADWSFAGAPILGTGTKSCFNDRIQAGAVQRFYRLSRLP